MKIVRKGLADLTRRWRVAGEGAATVEFALIMPVLAILWLGGFEGAQLLATNRKVTDTTSQLANVTAQYTAITKSETQSVMAAASQIMYPYSIDPLNIVMSEIQTDASGAATVTWSQAYQGGTPLTPGASWTLPVALRTPNTAYIFVQTNYTYTTKIGSLYFAPTIPISSQLYMSPRQIAAITCSDC